MEDLSKSQIALAKFLDQGKADPDTVQKLISGELRFDDRLDSAKLDCAGLSGSLVFIDENIDKSQGVASIHQGRLPQNVVVAYDSLLVAFSLAASPALVPANDAGYSIDQQSFPAALRNGKLVITQNDAVKVELDIKGLSTFGDSDRNPKDIAYKLNEAVVFEPGKLIKWEVQTPNGIGVPAVAATSYNMEISAFGVSTRSKG